MNPHVFRQLAEYLGGKMDYWGKEIQSQVRNNQMPFEKVELELTTKAIEKLQENSNVDTQNILKTMKEVAKSYNQDTTGIVQAVDRMTKALQSEKSETFLLKQHSNLLQQIATSAESLKKVANRTDDVQKLNEILAAVKANKPEKAEKTDLSELKVVSAELKTLNRELRTKTNKTLEEKVDKLAGAFQTFAENFKVNIPSEFKLDKMQMKQISMGGSGVQTRGATRVTVNNTAMADADTEYSYTFPANTVGFDINLRSQSVKLLYAWETGKMPTSGDGSAYATVPQNGLSTQGDIELSGKTIYLQSDTATQVAEIVSYQM